MCQNHVLCNSNIQYLRREKSNDKKAPWEYEDMDLDSISHTRPWTFEWPENGKHVEYFDLRELCTQDFH